MTLLLGIIATLILAGVILSVILIKKYRNNSISDKDVVLMSICIIVISMGIIIYSHLYTIVRMYEAMMSY